MRCPWAGLGDGGFGLVSPKLPLLQLKHLEALVSVILGGLNEAHEKTVRDTLQALGQILGCHQRRVCVGSMSVLIAEKLRPLLEDVRQEGDEAGGSWGGAPRPGGKIQFIYGEQAVVSEDSSAYKALRVVYK